MEHNELWLPIKDYECLYLVSDAGRILSLPKNGKPGRIVKQCVSNSGYFLVRLGKDGVTKGFSVHRLVAAAFCHNPNLKPEVNHKDGDKTNNSASNLEWVTGSENSVHKRDVIGNGNSPHTSQQRFTHEQIRAIRHSSKSNRELAREFGVSHSAIANIKSRKCYKEVE